MVFKELATPTLFVTFIVYAILAGSLYKVDNSSWNWSIIYIIIAGLITLLSLGFIIYDEGKGKNLYILLLFALISGYVFIFVNMNLMDTKKMVIKANILYQGVWLMIFFT